MAAEVVTIAEAVKDELNAAPFSISFTAERTYIPAYKLSEGEGELNDVKCAVVGVDPIEDALTRRTVDGSYEVQIGLAKRTGAEDTDGNDAMCGLAQEVVDRFFQTLDRKLTTVTGAKLLTFRWNPFYDLAMLRDAGIFYSVLSLRYAKER